MRKQIAIIDTGGNVKTERMEKKMFLFPKNVKRIGSANIWWAHWLSITTRMKIKKGGAHTDQPRFAEHSTDTPKMKTIPALISEIVCEMLQKRPNWESFLLIFFASLPVDISLSVGDFLFIVDALFSDAQHQQQQIEPKPKRRVTFTMNQVSEIRWNSLTQFYLISIAFFTHFFSVPIKNLFKWSLWVVQIVNCESESKRILNDLNDKNITIRIANGTFKEIKREVEKLLPFRYKEKKSESL